MNDFNITLTKDNRILKATSDIKEREPIGSQYDDEVQRFIFTRPEEFVDADLTLYLAPILQYATGSLTFEPINIGTDNEFVLTPDITKYSTFKLQVAFAREGSELEHSNELQFTLRPSISNKAASVPSQPQRIRNLESRAFSGARREGQTLAFYDINGEQVDSVDLPVGGESGRGFFAFDTQDGNLYFVADTGVENPFEYDEDTGNLYYKVV